MKNVFVKICGITRIDDAILAADLGADAIGFVFWPGSPRYIDPLAAREIVSRTAPGVAGVGVFVDEPVDHVAEIMAMVGLDMAQLHGSESPEYCGMLRRHVAGGAGASKGLIKAIGLQDGASAAISDFDSDMLILLDAHDPAHHGGTGRRINWDAARQIAASRRTILAGGLNPRNIARAVETVRPFGVDVSSGVESAPGVKDPDRLRLFFEALNE